MTRPKIEIDLKRVEELAGLGLTGEEIAMSLGISERTLYARQADSTEFADAMKRGRIAANAAVANTLYQKAMAGDNACMIFWLKSRAGWSDQRQAIRIDAEKTALTVRWQDDATNDDDAVNVAA